MKVITQIGARLHHGAKQFWDEAGGGAAEKPSSVSGEVLQDALGHRAGRLATVAAAPHQHGDGDAGILGGAER